MRKYICILYLLLMSVQLAIAQTERYEFWVDNDYDGRVVSLYAQPNFTLETDISTLASGLHTFNLRTQGSSGRWGGISRYLFYVKDITQMPQTMTKYEYWLDNDYEQRIVSSGSAVNSPLTLDISSLKPGLHSFNFRMQGSSGKWGGISRYLFYLKSGSGVQQVESIEYWIDNDGDSRLSQPVNDSTIVITADISNLEPGNHMFYVEGTTSSGRRTILNGYEFFLSELPIVNAPNITHEGNIVTMTADNDSVSIYYTLDGTTPTDSSTLYTVPIEVKRNCVVKAYGRRDGYRDSPIDSLVVDWFKVDSVVFSQNGRRLSLSTQTDNSMIYYGIDNGALDSLYTDTLTLNVNCTIRATAKRDGYNDADTTSFVFNVDSVTVVKPVFTHTDNRVAISTATPQAIIHYTTDGTMPNATSVIYTDTITVTRNCVIKAIALRENYVDSEIDSLVVDWFKVADVTFAQQGRRVSLATVTDNAQIYYRVGEGDLDQLYKDTLVMDSTCVVWAIAKREGYQDADTTHLAFNADSVTVAMPVIVGNGKKVGISTTTEQATIHYTLDGTTPTAQSPIYTDSITVDRNCTIKAIAMRQNWFDSPVATKSIDIFAVPSVTFAQDGRVVKLSNAMPEATVWYKLSTSQSLDGTEYVDSLLLTGDCTVYAWATRDGYNPSDTTSLAFVAADVTVAMPVIVGNGNKVGISTTTEQATIHYTLDGTTPTAQSPIYTDSITVDRNCTIKAIAMRQNWFDSPVATKSIDIFAVPSVTFAQDGRVIILSNPMPEATIWYRLSTSQSLEGTTYADSLLLTDDCTVYAWATRDGYNPSDTTTLAFVTADVTVAKPTIAVNGAKVGISTSTEQATIHYTLDGTTPTAQSPIYTDSITVDRNCTIKAIAMRQNWFDSPVATKSIDIFAVPSVTFAQDGRVVKLSNAMPEATIWYRLSTSQSLEGTEYADSLLLTGDCMVYAWATRDGYNPSDTTSLAFVAADVTVAKPVIAGNGNKVGISTTTEQAIIYYTWDGTSPTAQSPVYTDSITVEHNCTVKAIAMRQNWFDSEVDSLIVDWIVIGDASFDGLVATVSGERTLDEAFDGIGGRSEAVKTIAVIVWDKSTPITEDDLQDIDNPNLLVYVSEASLAPQGMKNVVVDGRAKNIVLTDAKEGNNNFYAPQAFTAEKVSYTREFQQETQVGVSRGWETIALPFDVQTISHERQGIIVPFGNTTSGKHFWLRRLGSSGLTQATMIEANVPYVISMPNDVVNYPEEFNLSGKVTFSAVNVTVPVTSPVTLALADNTIMMVPAFQRVGRSSEVWALNVGEARSQYFEGSTFERDYREVRPFEAYTVHRGNGPAPRFVPVMEFGGTTGIEDLTPSFSKGEGTWYDLNGRRLQQKPTRKGVYILNGSKRVIE